MKDLAAQPKLSDENVNVKTGHSKKAHSVKTGAAVLAVGSVVAKILGALYRVPLTNVLGAEGMGLYQLVFPVYALFMVLSTVGIPVALSRIVAEQRAIGKDAKKYLFACMLTLISLASVFSVLIVGLAKQIAIWQGNPAAYKGFYVIAPSLVLVSAIAGFRGWFQGEMYMLPTAVSNVIEQLVKLAVGLTLSVLLAKRGVIYAVYGALLGVTVSEFVALVYMVVTYAVRNRGVKSESLKLLAGEGRDVFKIAFPIAIVSVMLPLSNFFDSMIIVNMLKLFGLSGEVATSQYGLLSGPVNSLVNMPIVFTLSLAVVLVPYVAVSRLKRDISSILLHSRLSIKLVYMISVPFAIFFAVFSRRLMQTVYPALDSEQLILVSNMLKISMVSVVTLSAMQVYVSLMQAVDKTKMAVLSLGCAVFVKIILQLLLTRFLGIIGSSLASASMGIVALLTASGSYFKIVGLRIEKNIAINLVCGVIMGLVGIVVEGNIKNDFLCLVVGALVCLLVYVWTVFAFGLIGKEELGGFPAGKVIAKIHRIVRFWEYK